MSTPILDLIRREESAAPCDRCHDAPGAVWFDQFWVCAECWKVFDSQLRYEMVKGYRLTG